MTTPRKLLLALALPVVYLVALGLVLCIGTHAATVPGRYVATEAEGIEVCFPARSWNTGTASYEDRPCDLLRRPQEDGSGRLYLGTIGADAAVCVIPNPYEERGRFAVRCHRVPNR